MADEYYEYYDYEKPIVIDNGSGICKAGLAGQASPTVVFPSIVGYPKGTVEKGEKSFYVGQEARDKMGSVTIKYPLGHGRVENWDDLQKIWEHVYEEMGVRAKDHPVLLTEPPFNPKNNREKMTEMMFETFRAPAIYVAIQAVLALYSSGRTTGIVLDIGDGVSHTVPIYEGFSVAFGTTRLDVAGRDLTEHLQRLLLKKNFNFSTSAELEFVRQIKEQYCFVKPYGNEFRIKKKDLMKKFDMPSGEEVILLEERYKCPEALFDPTLIGKEDGGIHDQIYKSIMKCDVDIRKEMFENVILSGGTTLLPGLEKRLADELNALVPPSIKVKVCAPPERKYSVWMGGSVLANLKTFEKMWISKDEYYETGAHIVHRKCF